MEVYERLRKIAEREDRTVSAEVRRLIRERVERENDDVVPAA